MYLNFMLIYMGEYTEEVLERCQVDEVQCACAERPACDGDPARASPSLPPSHLPYHPLRGRATALWISTGDRGSARIFGNGDHDWTAARPTPRGERRARNRAPRSRPER